MKLNGRVNRGKVAIAWRDFGAFRKVVQYVSSMACC